MSTVESLITLSALILHMGVRVMNLSAGLMEEGTVAFIYPEEIGNFVISGFAAYWGWVEGSRELQRRLRR